MPNARLVGHAGRVGPPTGCHLCGVVILRATSGSSCADEPRPARACFKSGMVSSMSLSSLDFPATHAEVSQARVVVMDAAQDLVQHSLVSGGQEWPAELVRRELPQLSCATTACTGRFRRTRRCRSGGFCTSWESVLRLVASQRSSLLALCSSGSSHSPSSPQAVGHRALQTSHAS